MSLKDREFGRNWTMKGRGIAGLWLSVFLVQLSAEKIDKNE
jgi:hypothetical protein